jgi:hypothetical protein
VKVIGKRVAVYFKEGVIRLAHFLTAVEQQSHASTAVT